jgi:hypothetical protein
MSDMTTVNLTDEVPLRLSYSGKPGQWTAALRAGRRVVATCGHLHRNRDSGTDNANTCGIHHVIAARTKSSAELLVNKSLAAAGIARRLGARITDDAARATAESTISQWRDVVIEADFHTAATWTQRQAGRMCGCCPHVDVQAAIRRVRNQETRLRREPVPHSTEVGETPDWMLESY